MVWGGISMKVCTNIYRLDRGTLSAIKYRDEILGPQDTICSVGAIQTTEYHIKLLQ